MKKNTLNKLIKKYKPSKSTLKSIQDEIEKDKNSKYKTLSITLNRRIKGQPRPRVGRFSNIYDPFKAYKNKLWSQIIKRLINKYDIKTKNVGMSKFLNTEISKSVSVKIFYFHKIPAGFSLKKKILALLNVYKVDRTPDIDNIEKLILDTINKKMIKDDRFIWKVKTVKKWAEKFRCKIIIKYKE